MYEINNDYDSPIQDNSLNSIYSKTFGWMFVGIFLTAIISWGLYSSNYALTLAPSFGIIGFINLAVAIIFGFCNNKLSSATCGLLFLIYSAINGVTLSVIYYIYDLSSIIMILFAAAGLFGCFAFLGFNSKTDLTNIGSLCMGVLILGIILTVVNMFMGNSQLDLALSWIILIAFFGITAYDMQKIREMVYHDPNNSKIHINAAFSLYLDFINIFLRLLMLFGKSRD